MRWGQVELKQENDSVKKIKQDLESRKKRARRRKRKRLFKRIFILLFFAAFIYGLYQFDQSNYSRLETLVTKGNNVLSVEEIESQANLKINDRIYPLLSKNLERKIQSHDLIEKAHVTISRRKQTVMIAVEEKRPLAHDDSLLYFTDELSVDKAKNEALSDALPRLMNIADEEILKSLLKNLAKVDEASLLAVSEIYHKPNDLDKEYLELVMNQGYFVYTSINTLPLLNNYATIISGADPKNRCIYILEYGPTEDTHVATAKPCDE